jgi:hypothetical protein
MCWHKYKYIGSIRVRKWLGGVSGGIPVEVTINAKQCTKCGKIKEVA